MSLGEQGDKNIKSRMKELLLKVTSSWSDFIKIHFQLFYLSEIFLPSLQK